MILCSKCTCNLWKFCIKFELISCCNKSFNISLISSSASTEFTKFICIEYPLDETKIWSIFNMMIVNNSMMIVGVIFTLQFHRGSFPMKPLCIDKKRGAAESVLNPATDQTCCWWGKNISCGVFCHLVEILKTSHEIQSAHPDNCR